MDEFIKKLVKGDEKAFERLVRENQNRVYAVCLNMMKNPHDAQDAAQDAFVKAFRSIRSFKGESRIETWLTKIAVNTCLDMLRSRRETVDIDEQYDLTDGNTPEIEFERGSRREAVREALSRLPAEFRAVVILKYVEDRSYEEIAEMLNINVNTVRTRLFRAREKIKKIILDNRELF